MHLAQRLHKYISSEMLRGDEHPQENNLRENMHHVHGTITIRQH